MFEERSNTRAEAPHPVDVITDQFYIGKIRVYSRIFLAKGGIIYRFEIRATHKGWCHSLVEAPLFRFLGRLFTQSAFLLNSYNMNRKYLENNTIIDYIKNTVFINGTY